MAPQLLPTESRLLSNGRRLRLARIGQGPPIVLLHGYPETLQVWSGVAPLLADRFTVIAFDWPGQGESDEWPGGATPQLLARRLATLCGELSLEQPTVVGTDMGGQPALALAAHEPAAISRLVVMNSLVFGDGPTSWEIRLLRRFGFNRFALRRLPGIVFGRALATFMPPGTRLDPAVRDEFWDAFRQPAVRRFVSKMCAAYQGTLPTLPALYPRVSCPTLVLWGERDKHFPLAQGRRLAATIPGARLETIAGGTHWMPLARAAEVADHIGRFAAG